MTFPVCFGKHLYTFLIRHILRRNFSDLIRFVSVVLNIMLIVMQNYEAVSSKPLSFYTLLLFKCFFWYYNLMMIFQNDKIKT